MELTINVQDLIVVEQIINFRAYIYKPFGKAVLLRLLTFDFQ